MGGSGAAYQQAIAASPESAFLYRDLGSVERQAGQLAEALEHYRKAVELDATDARSLARDRRRSSKRQGDVSARWPRTNGRAAIDPPRCPTRVIARVRARAALAKLPAEYRAIPGDRR